MVRICFVCLGNICRSPTAEAVMHHLCAEAGVTEKVHIDSAGTAAYHAGEPPDRRSSAAARARGVDMHGAARQFKQRDFHRFDYVLAMDLSNYENLIASSHTGELEEKIYMLRSFDAQAPAGAEVPDPYYGGSSGFEDVLDICFDACRGLLEHLIREHDLR